MEIILMIAGMAVGMAASSLILKITFSKEKAKLLSRIELLNGQTVQLAADLQIERERNRMLSENRESAYNSLSEKEDAIIGLNRQVAEKDAEMGHLYEKLDAEKAELADLRGKFEVAFKNLANEIMEEKSRRFMEQNKAGLAGILLPLNEKIREFEAIVRDSYDRESKERFSLQNEIKNLVELNKRIGDEANNLASALKGGPKTRGLWGEMILEGILEGSGLVKGREYHVQPSYENGPGKRFQPDVVVDFPGGRSVVIDSKVSLNAYERYCASENTKERDAALKEHLQSVKRHVDDLSAKNYHSLPQIRNPDFVIMFMPVEPAYLLAIQTDPELWRYAHDRHVLLISPTNLIAVLKMVENLWRQDHRNRNAEEIARQSGALYDKFVGFSEELIEIGKKLAAAMNHHETAMRRLCTGKGNLVKRAMDIREMGAKTAKTLPNALFDRMDEN